MIRGYRYYDLCPIGNALATGFLSDYIRHISECWECNHADEVEWAICEAEVADGYWVVCIGNHYYRTYKWDYKNN